MGSRRAYSAALGKLQQLEAAVVLQDQRYVSAADVAVLLEHSERSHVPAPALSGLASLESSLTAALDELQGVQEAVYSKLRADVHRCTELYNASSPAWKSILEFDYAQQQSADSGALWAAMNSNRRRSELVSKGLQKQLQDIHDGSSADLDVKVQAYESVVFCFETYARLLAAAVEVAASGQQHGGLTGQPTSAQTAKVARLLQPRLHSLLIHPALREHEACSVASEARKIWDAAFFKSKNETFAERKMIQSSVTIKSASVTFMKMGAGGVLTLWALSECFNNDSLGDHHRIWQDPTFAIFMCFGDLLLLLWLWGLSMQIWRAAGIDFVGLLSLEKTEVDGRRAPELIVYTAATDLTLMFLTVFICFNKAARGVLSLPGSLALAHALSVLMVVYFLFRILSPWNESRKKWLYYLWQVVAAPFFAVSFRDSYIGDLLTSLVRVLIPMCFSFAYLGLSAVAWMTDNMNLAASTNTDAWWQDSVYFRLYLVPFLTLFPLWIRLMQCLRRSVETGRRWPHMANAAKYTSAIVVISFGTFHPQLRENPLWILCFVGATLFQFVWDLTMDWGLVVRASSRGASAQCSFLGWSLRHTRLLGPQWVYLVVISANLLLRFAWTLTLLPADLSKAESLTLYGVITKHVGPLIAAGEVARRMVWGFFRLEFEQLEVLGPPETNNSLGGGSGGSGGMEKVQMHSCSRVAYTPRSSTYSCTHSAPTHLLTRSLPAL